ncbi:TonB-dependent receptor [Pseudoxanthomonas winnipegensis]|uniref:TonB-dependent receptor n=1 Tax=Pseudoxanthomonas winnipegensis TaxID=2480810 RepID=A0A4Q8M238_9GAMM|nr:TonB-dependent receptor [Pseudoxanthomonas winnipegensis]RZZ86734.1 TonB-dependent receptor [Pseudoxanthomonas winnipegensis]TAA38094.1 TonB-dependent receptor [Pseudoxanthomonas winnipegensis]
MSNIRGIRPLSRTIKRSALSIALGMCVAGGVQAQSTSGSIYGKADSGQTITIVSDTGLTRTVTAEANGSFSIASLPAGAYKVTSGGQTRDVLVKVNSGAQVDFTAAQNLDKVTVVGRAPINEIDVSQTDTRTVFTAQELQRISVGRDINSVALLAPGVINSTSYNSTSSNVGSFGGSAASENAYYINGFPVTNPLTAIGSTTLPFDAIAQQQVLTGGYGAEYGRSTGGVISIVTKRGTNEWHGGVYTIYTPQSLRAKAKDIYYPDTGYWSAENHYPAYNTTPQNWTDGKLYKLNSKNTSNNFTYGIWAGGPLIKDRLFIYADAERTEIDSASSRITGNLQGKTASGASAISASNRAQGWGEYEYTYPRWVTKIDWNITDNHILELTGVQDNSKTDASYYGYDYDKLQHDDVLYATNKTETKTRLYVGKYTGYLTDALSVSAMYGEQHIDIYPNPMAGYDPSVIYTDISSSVVPAQYASISNPQKYGPTYNYVGADDTKAYRFDLNYTLGDHELRAGYDYFEAVSFRGDNVVGPTGYYWTYSRSNNPTAAIDASHYVGSPASGGGLGTGGYYVAKSYSGHGGDTTVKQKAYYLEDRWHVTENLLLSLGLRNDGFTNYNGDGEEYLKQENNWAPRIGFSWDVNGDSTFKIYGNAGRYHLAVPNNVSVRGSNPSLSTTQYYTYTGIAADGTPIGLNPVPYTRANSPYNCPDGSWSSNVECGQKKDPRTIAAVGLKAHYQDEYILGFDRQEDETFSWGLKGTYRELKSAIDDICPDECYIFNAGDNSATFYVDDGTGNLVKQKTDFVEVFGTPFPKLKRKYGALDSYVQWQGDNYFARLTYTLSHNWGNAEGQLNSSTDTGNGGQADVSVTQDWDLPELMVGKNGSLPNNRTHQLKVIGSYSFNDEWSAGGSIVIQSGRPKSCTSYWPYAKTGLYNNAYYAYCGVPGATSASNNPANAAPMSDSYYFSPRGAAGETPWTSSFNVNVAYTPRWLEGLTLQADVLNLFNTQDASAYYERSASTRTTVNPQYGRVLYYTTPRAVRFTARYDF